MSFETTPVTNAVDAPKPTIQATIPGSEQKEVPVETPQPAKEPQFSERFASLAKKERKIQAMHAESKALREQTLRKEQELAQREAKLKQFESINDPIALLQSRGYTYEQATDWVLNNGKPSPEFQIQDVRKELTQIREEERLYKEQLKKEAEAQAQQELLDVEDQFKGTIQEFVTGEQDRYELINLYNAHNLVYDKVKEHWDKTREVLDIKKASDIVESLIEAKVKQAQQAKKFRAQQAQPGSDEPRIQPKSQAPSRTLTNSMTQSSAPSFLPAKTENDRIQRALAALDR